MQALEEFIALKECQINRLVCVDENLDTILETEWLKDYILTLPNRDRSGATMLPFCPEEIMTNKGVNPRERAPQVSIEAGTTDECGPVPIELLVDPLAHLPDVQPREYFGPNNNAPPQTSGANRSQATSRTQLGTITSTSSIPRNVGVGIVEGRVEAFSTFDPHKDIAVDQFVAVLSHVEERRLGAIFYVDKVRALERAATADGVMTVTWYWPKMRRGSTDAVGKWHQWYTNWKSRYWEPSKEADDNFMVNTTMTSWTNPTNRNTPMCMVHGVRVEKEIKIPEG